MKGRTKSWIEADCVWYVFPVSEILGVMITKIEDYGIGPYID